MFLMSSAPPEQDLMPGARNAVGTCLAIQRGERVALIADQASAPVASSLAAALDEGGARTDAVLIESVSARPMRSAPPRILEALEHADAGILCVQPQEGELPARMAIVALIERRRIRYAHMVGVTPQIMAARRLSPGRSPEPAAVRADAHRIDVDGENPGRHRVHRHLRSVARMGEDQRADQSALLVEPAGGGGLHHARVGGWAVRL
jgi:hypothetical protein